MFLLHYIVPAIVFYFYRNEIMLFGLEVANLIDLDHIYYRIIGKVGWFNSACSHLGEQCSWDFYCFHNFYVLTIALILIPLLFLRGNKYRFARLIGWIGLGILIHLFLDYMQLLTGICI
jgi:hypothetical protein